jgi:hypothetical protein
VSLTLLWPWAVLAAPLPWVAARVLPAAPPPRREALRMPDLMHLWAPRPRPWRAEGPTRAARGLAWTGWGCLILAWAQPAWVVVGAEPLLLYRWPLGCALGLSVWLALHVSRRPRRYRRLRARGAQVP